MKDTSRGQELNKISLQQIIDSQNELMIFAVDTQLRYTSFSKSYKNLMKLLWGMEIEVGVDITDYVTDLKFKKKLKENFEKVLRGDSFSVTEKFSLNDSHLLLRRYYSPIFDSQNKVVGVSAFVINLNSLNVNPNSEKQESESVEHYVLIEQAVILTDSYGYIKGMNEKSEELTGWSYQEAKGKKLSDVFKIIDGATKERIVNLVDNLLKRRLIMGFSKNTILITRSGSNLPIIESAITYPYKRGEVEKLIFIFRESSERENINRGNDLGINSDEMISQELNDLYFLVNNKFYLTFFNFSFFYGNELTTENLSLIVSLDNIFPQQLSNKTKEKIREVLEKNRIIEYNYSLFVGKEKRFFEIHLIPYSKTEVLAFINDITEQKLAELQVKIGDDKLRKIFEGAPFPMHIINNKFEILSSNQQMQDTYNVTQKDIIGKHCYEIYHGNKTVCKDCIALKVLRTKEPQKIINKSVDKDGKISYHKTFVYPIREERNQVTELVETTIDITDQVVAEKKLLENEERLKTLINTTPDIIYFKDGEGRWLTANKAYLNLFFPEGIDYFGRTGVELSEYTFPLYRDMFRKCIETDEIAWKKRELSIVEEVIPLHQGGNKIFEVIKVPLFNDDGSRKGLVVLGRDITERKIAVEKLQESEENFRKLAETTAAAIFVFRNNKFLYANKITELYTGYSAAELIGMNIWKVMKPELRNFVKKYAKFKDNRNKIISRYEIMFFNRFGKTLWLDFSVTRIIWNGKSAILASAINITDRKKAELELKKNERKYRMISDLTSDYIFESKIDKKGIPHTFWVSESFEKITGYSLSEFLKIGGWSSIVHPDDMEIDSKTMSDVLNNRESSCELRIIRKDGTTIWVSIKVKPIWSDEEKRVVGNVGAVSDITERKKMIEELIKAREIAEASDKIKSEFLAQMSHEIRSPLNIILNFTSLLKMEFGDNADEDVKFAFASIDSSSRRIYRTVDLILNMTELQTGNYRSVIAKTEVISIIKNIILEYEKATEVKRIKLDFFTEVEALELHTDEFALTQIIINIVDNAVKYTNEGSVTVRVSGAQFDFVKVIVSDTGVGISKEYLPKIYEMFSQEEQGYSRSFDGNGLGMALVASYIEIINGTISVESKKGEGTTFTVVIPNLK